MLLVLACAAPVPKTTTSDPSPTSDSGTPPSTVPTGDTSSSPPTGDTGAPSSLVPALWTGDCSVDLTGAAPLPTRELFRTLQGDYDLYHHPGLQLPLGAVITVFPAEAEYLDWLSSTGLAGTDAALAVVDWTTEIVVAGTYFAASSCGGTLSRVEASDVAGAPHVSMAMLDTSYACIWLCEASLQGVWIVAVPRGAEPATACLGVGGGCGELP